MILVSACLAGVNCAWDGKNKLNKDIKDMVDKGLAIPVCPEVLGGRSVPRTKTELRGGNGEHVLDGKAKVFDENGKDVTSLFLKGARATLEVAKRHGIKKAILKSKSPSCGVGKIYDGNFRNNLVDGNGVTVALLIREGILCQNI